MSIEICWHPSELNLFSRITSQMKNSSILMLMCLLTAPNKFELSIFPMCSRLFDRYWNMPKHSGLGSPVRKVWGRESFSPVREVWGEEAFNKREEEEMEIEMEEEEKDVEKEMEEEEEMDGDEFEKQDEAGRAEDHVRSTGKRNLRK